MTQNKRRKARKSTLTVTQIPARTPVTIKSGARSQLDGHSFEVDTLGITWGVNHTYSAWIAVEVDGEVWSYHQADLILAAH